MGVRDQMERGKATPRSLLPKATGLGLLQRKCACGGAAGTTNQCSKCRGRDLAGDHTGDQVLARVPSTQKTLEPGFAATSVSGHRFGLIPVQAEPAQGTLGKLTVSSPGDPQEREADELAESVLRIAPTPAESQSEANDGSGVARRSSAGRVGQLSVADLAFFSPRFGFDFSEVRIHTDGEAARSARRFNALAYTAGADIAFGEGQYAPGTAAGRRLLAHELAHVVQQGRNGSQVQGVNIQRTAASCPSDWRKTVQDDHDRALGMIDVARSKLSSYDGTTPTEVNTALATHFHATSATFGGWVNLNLGFLRHVAPLASYDCEDTSSWWCGGGANAKTFWCVPFVDIRVCQPSYFSNADEDRSRILIHEWVHKYGCNFDLGYAWEPGYSNSWTITALMNADPFARFVQAVQ
jgi:hypothetical protein